MQLQQIFAFLFLIILTTNVHATKEDSFSIACQIFTEAINTSFSKKERNTYIENNINNRTSNEVKSTYNIVFNVNPKERYDIFKQAAEHATQKSWDCPAAKLLLR